MIPFNINQGVRVKLTEHGRAIHRANHKRNFKGAEDRYPYLPPVEDCDGWSRWQLWALMAEFGEHIGMARPHPFDGNMELDPKS